MKDGRIVYENYRNNTNEETRFIAFSMTKSIISILVGVALEERRIKSLDNPIDRYLPELGSGGYRGVTIRQILQMRSGVDYEERYDFGNPGIAASNHEHSLVENVARFADAARTVNVKIRRGQCGNTRLWILPCSAGFSSESAAAARWRPTRPNDSGNPWARSRRLLHHGWPSRDGP